MSLKKLMGNAVSDPSGLVGNAIATAFSLAVAVYISATVSGEHVNPAVTFGMAIGGSVSISVAIIYWISQILGSVMACLLLKVATVGQHVRMHGIIPDEMTGFGASILEGVMTFALVYTVYADLENVLYHSSNFFLLKFGDIQCLISVSTSGLFREWGHMSKVQTSVSFMLYLSRVFWCSLIVLNCQSKLHFSWSTVSIFTHTSGLGFVLFSSSRGKFSLLCA